MVNRFSFLNADKFCDYCGLDYQCCVHVYSQTHILELTQECGKNAYEDCRCAILLTEHLRTRYQEIIVALPEEVELRPPTDPGLISTYQNYGGWLKWDAVKIAD